MTPPDTGHRDADTPADTPGEFLTLGAAARRFTVSVSTLHRRRKRGDLAAVGAFKDHGSGSWMIPVTGLAQLGYELRETPPDTPTGTPTAEKPVTRVDTGAEEAETASDTLDTVHDTYQSPRVADGELETLRQRLEAAEAEAREAREMVAEVERRAAVAEAVAAERNRLIEVQERSLRMLEPGPSASAPSPVTPPSETTTPAPEGTTREQPAPKPAQQPPGEPRGFLGRLFGGRR